ncbi:flagellar hook assembly protein FlgD [Alicycliphilus denitrificans]|jgi:flagellar basal-body rod modification protein FlgD|uniref:Basal-body rod modification protein FlgD n=1 Tax=Alicycliphilus denitrificans TaxID=179636 RepID=A0A420KDT2_9BURK|nr:flagellar hook capping FlgD N-terminal domain-containing protein [Alicycliphilus denitrificans]RKJ97353.1 flagellar hook assembly protein FlgD [Alicycliphilus denitrificans]HRO80300.1 flagellar hook capping FlgD N-terminal domain-containing protein [Alicycliphilus denitrificans]
MFISPIDTSALNAGATTTSTTRDSSTDPSAMQDRFLKLLVAQLNNQDPMNPLDNAQMTTQMAQINTVTGLQTLNLTMQTMAEQFSTMQQIQGISLIGRSVLSEGDRMSFADGTGKGMFDLAGAATNVKVDIVTAGGVVVDSIDMGAQEGGRHSVEWDASKYQGSTSDLRFRVTATSGETAVKATALMQSQVLATGSQSGALTLTLDNGSTVNYANVLGVL